MNNRRWLVAAGSAILLLAGCDRSDTPAKQSSSTDKAVTVAPQTQPAQFAQAGPIANAPATQPAATQPRKSSLEIVENYVVRAYEFPRARLHINRGDKTAVLYSDDPRNAIEPGYSGNSFYLVVPLDDAALERLNGYAWQFKSTSSEHHDSADGVFLDGQHFHLQPSNIIVAFRGEGPKLEVGLNGSFFKFDSTDTSRPGNLVNLNGILSASVDAGK
ncbi:MAG TPA: hypothetical protein VFC78_24435 [Tepidisphaeraceae bacterium]|nr:hypothetical protein [Tepidisphaeraceae bacterium]